MLDGDYKEENETLGIFMIDTDIEELLVESDENSDEIADINEQDNFSDSETKNTDIENEADTGMLLVYNVTETGQNVNIIDTEDIADIFDPKIVETDMPENIEDKVSVSEAVRSHLAQSSGLIMATVLLYILYANFNHRC